MHIKTKREKMFFVTLAIFLLFCFTAAYFYSVVKDNNYLGIRAQKEGSVWYIKRIQIDGSAQEEDLRTGDRIVKIDGQDPQKDQLLNQWLIVEQAGSLLTARGEKEIATTFKKGTGSQQRFYIFLLLSCAGFGLLFRYVRKLNHSRMGVYFHSFIILMLFALTAVVPSSIGNALGRIVVITFLSLFPVYLNLFLTKTYEADNNDRFNSLQVLFICIAACNIVLSLFHLAFGAPNILAEYLAQGIFYVLGISLVVLLLRNVWQRNRAAVLGHSSKLNLAFISILSFLPLFLCYIFPIRWEVPFFVAVPFLLLPLLAVLHILGVSKLIFYRYRLADGILYLILTIVLTGICWMLLLLREYLPLPLLVVYSFLLLYSFLPFVEEFLYTMKRRTELVDRLALFSAVEEERENISTFIHDTVIQEVIYYMKEIDGSREVSKRETTRILEEVVFYLRELCSDIYPLMIQEIGLKNTLLSMIGQFEKKHPVIINHDIMVADLSFSPQKNNFILRSIKELMNNSILHGNASEISLTVYGIGENCYFRVMDNGRFQASKKEEGKHFGLSVIIEKIGLLNGSISIQTEDQTIITIKLPFDEQGEMKRKERGRKES